MTKTPESEITVASLSLSDSTIKRLAVAIAAELKPANSADQEEEKKPAAKTRTRAKPETAASVKAKAKARKTEDTDLPDYITEDGEVDVDKLMARVKTVANGTVGKGRVNKLLKEMEWKKVDGTLQGFLFESGIGFATRLEELQAEFGDE